jgi:hypothetical protein
MYIPKSKLDPEIYYTPGGEYYYSTTRNDYEGYYHKDLNGRSYTGKEHTNESILLIPVTPKTITNPNINNYDVVSNQYTTTNSSQKSNGESYSVPIPQNDSLPPTQQDYEQSFYIRYIIQYKLSSKPVFIEVNKTTYFNYLNTSYRQYFSFVEVPWKISGPLYDVKQGNVLVEGGIIDSNLRSIDMANKTMPGVKNYFTDITLYTIQ